VLAKQDHLGWGRVHLVGHSMGSMIAEKVAVLQPSRVESLLLISATGGGFQAIPRSWECLKICIQVFHSSELWSEMILGKSHKTSATIKPGFQSFEW
jgi:pimeloyl-ACP methyl ester carboxylesterase